MTGLLLLLSFGQIDVYQGGAYVGRSANAVDCFGSATCTITGDGGAKRVRVTATSADGGGVTPSGLCGDGGTALGWNGTEYTCTTQVAAASVLATNPTDCSAGQYATAIAASGNLTCAGINAGGWVQVAECIFEDAGTKSLDAGDGLYSICGYSWTLKNGNNTTNRPYLQQGAGVLLQPTQTSDVWSTTFTAPMLTMPLTTFYPSLTYETPFRLTLYVHGNFSANYDQANLGVWVNGAATNGTFIKAAIAYSAAVQVAVSNGNSSASGRNATPKPEILQFTMPGGLASGAFGGQSGFWSSGWPTQGALSPIGNMDTYTIAWNFSGDPKPFSKSDGGMDQFEAFIPCMRSNSATNLVCNLRGFKMEVRP